MSFIFNRTHSNLQNIVCRANNTKNRKNNNFFTSQQDTMFQPSSFWPSSGIRYLTDMGYPLITMLAFPCDSSYCSFLLTVFTYLFRVLNSRPLDDRDTCLTNSYIFCFRWFAWCHKVAMLYIQKAHWVRICG